MKLNLNNKKVRETHSKAIEEIHEAGIKEGRKKNMTIDILWNTLFVVCGFSIGIACQHDYPIFYNYIWAPFVIEFILFIIMIIIRRKQNKEVKA